MSEPTPEVDSAPPPVVTGTPYEVARGVYVIPDGRVPLVPNIGLILGEERVLVVDTGMGPESGRRVRAVADQLRGARDLVLTITHFHPEHGFGASVFGDATIVYNAAQRDEFHGKAPGYLEMFRTFGDNVAAALEGVELIGPTQVYDGDAYPLDLGERLVELRTWGRAHTLSDQVVFLPEERILFTGDLVEESCFAIVPYFPPDNTDVDGGRWIAVLEQLEALDPRIVVPGHGGIGGVSIIRDAREYLTALRSETRRLKADGATVEAAVEELDARMRSFHPDWLQPEWIGFGVRHFYDAG